MSSIDERIVQLELENREFETNARQSIRTLGNLDRALDLKSGSKGLDEVRAAAEKTNFAPLLNAANMVSDRLSTLGIVGVTALQHITNAAMTAGTQLAKSLTIDQVTAGWNKYVDKTASVQTLVNATGKSATDIGRYLNKLMWFSDETSYSFTEMASALGQMVSNGGNIDNLIPMLEGMANATAYAGKGANEFQRILYNLNQSYGQGYLSLMDWRSVQLANVGTEALQKALIEAGKEVGTLNAEGKTAKGTLVEVGSLGSTLAEKWATAEVMEKAFGGFAEMTEKAYEMVQNGDVETASEAYAILAKEYDNVAIRAAKAAQEAKSFREAIDATKDAVSSGWMQIFEAIFGNYEVATKTWTALANGLWDFFASGIADSAKRLNNTLNSQIDDLGSYRDMLFQGIGNALLAVADRINIVRDAFHDIFPAPAASTIQKAIMRFRFLSATFRPMEEETEMLTDGFRGVFSIFATGAKIASNLVNALSPLGALIGDLGGSALFVFSRTGIMLQKIFDLTNTSGFQNFFANLKGQVKGITDSVRGFNRQFSGNFILYGGEFVRLLDRIAMFRGYPSALDAVQETIGKLMTALGNSAAVKKTGEFFESFKSFMTGVKGKALDIPKGLFDLLGKGAKYLFGDVPDLWTGIMTMKPMNGLIDRIGPNLQKLKPVLSAFGESLQPLRDFFKELKAGGVEAFSNLATSAKNLGVEGFGAIKDFFSDFSTNFQKFIDGGYITTFANFRNTLENVTEWLRNAGGKAGEFAEKVKEVVGNFKLFQSISDFVKDIPGMIGTGLAKIPESLYNAGKGIGSAIGSFFNGISDGLGKISTSGIGQFFKSGLLDAFTITLIKLIWDFSSMIKNIGKLGEIGESVSKFLDTVSGSIKAFSNQVKVKTVKDIAISIGLLAASMLLLASIPSDRLMGVVGALAAAGVTLGVMFAVVSVAAVKMSKIKDFKLGSLTVMTKALKRIAATVAILASSLRVISGLKWEEIRDGLLGLAIGMGILLASMWILTKISSNFNMKDFLSIGTSVVAMAAAVLVLSVAVKKFSSMKWDELKTGLAAVGYLITMMSFAMAVMGKARGSAANGFGLLEMAAALLIMTTVLARFSAFTSDLTSAYKAFGIMSSCLAAMTIALKILGSGKSGLNAAAIAASGFAMLECAAALLVIAGAIKMLANSDVDDVSDIAIALSGALLVLGLAANNFTKAMPGATAMLVVSAAMLVLAIGMRILMAANPNGVTTAIVALAGVMVVLGLAAYYLGTVSPTMVAIASSMALMGLAAIGLAAAALLLSVGITILSQLEFWSMMGAVLGMALVMIALAGALAIIGSVSGLTIAGAAALILLGVAFVIASAAVIGFAVGCMLLQTVDLAYIAEGVAAMGAELPVLAFGLITAGVGALVAAAGLTALGLGCVAAAVGLLAISVGGGVAAAAALLLAEALDLVAGVLGKSNGYFSQYADGLSETISSFKEQTKAAEEAKKAAEEATSQADVPGVDTSAFTGSLDQMSSKVTETKAQVTGSLSEMSEAASNVDVTGGLQTGIETSAEGVDMTAVATTLYDKIGISMGEAGATGVPSGMQDLMAQWFGDSGLDYNQYASAFTGNFTGAMSDQDFSALGQVMGINVSEAFGSDENLAMINGQGTSVFNEFLAGAQTVDGTSTGEGLMDTLIAGFTKKNGEVKTAGETAGKAGVDGANSVSFGDTGLNFALGLASGILSGRINVTNAARTVAQAALNAANGTLRVASPSRRMKWTGRMFDEGFMVGMLSEQEKVAITAGGVAAAALDAFDGTTLDVDSSVYSRFVPVVSMDGVNLGTRQIAANGSMAMAGTLEGGSRSGSFSRELDRIHEQLDRLASIGQKTCAATEAGHDIVFDDGKLAGRINRRLGGFA